jgi:hypothetical protein
MEPGDELNLKIVSIKRKNNGEENGKKRSN